MSARAVPFHCPYCSSEDLYPFDPVAARPALRPPHEVTDGPAHGAWECRSCLRAFKLNLLGLLRPGGARP